MANTTTGGYENLISSIVQRGVQLMPVFRKLASFREEARLQNGRSVNRPTMTNMNVVPTEDYVANTDISSTAWAVTQELMTVNNQKALRAMVDATEEKDLIIPKNIITQIGGEFIKNLTTALDRDYLDEITNAANSVDAADFGGSALSPIDFSTTPIEDAVSLAAQEIEANPFRKFGTSKYVLMDSYMIYQTQKRGLALLYNTADKIFMNGFTGAEFMGCNVYKADLPWTITLTLSDVAVADETFTIDGVTCTAKAAPAVAGQFDVEASATAQGDTIAALINGTGTPGADTYIELSTTNRAKWRARGIHASNAAGVVTITGYGRVTVSGNLTNGSFGTMTVYSKVGYVGDVDMVAQLNPFIKITDESGNFGRNVLGMTRWATKTFSDGAQNGCALLYKG